MTSGGMLVMENVPLGLRQAPRTECWIPGVESFVAATVSISVVHDTLWSDM